MYKYNATTNLEKIFDEIKRGSEIVGILVGITIASLFIALISESIYPLCMPVIVISSLVTYALGYNLFSKKEKIKRKMNKFFILFFILKTFPLFINLILKIN